MIGTRWQGIASRLKERRTDLAVFAGAVVLATYIGPFATISELSFFARLAYWTLAIAAGFAGAELHYEVVKPRLIRAGRGWLTPVSGTVLITAAALSAVLVLEAVFRDAVPVRALGQVVIGVLIVSLAIWGTAQLGERPSRRAAGEDGAEDPLFAKFTESWPAALREAPLWALSAEDHYVRVHTEAGEALVAGRFRDALDAVGSREGLQVHRSWWVASNAVEALERRGGQWRLRLAGGVAAPVSRAFRPEVRAAGWDRLAG